MLLLDWYRRVVRFAIRGRRPDAIAEVPTWGLCVPYRLWHAVIRHDGRTFEEFQTAGLGPAARRLVPMRALYLAFLLLWPLVAGLRALARGRDVARTFRIALTRPDLAVYHPDATFTEAEAALGRPDHALGMLYAWWFSREKSAFFALDDKRVFADACEAAGLPTPRRLTIDEAIARGVDVVVKDPEDDLGYGVRIVNATELRAIPDVERLVVQERLRNDPALLAVLPETGPLSSFRVITILDLETRRPRVYRTATRIGHAGVDVDNTQQGGFWCRVDLATGEIMPGVKKADFNVHVDGRPVRHAIHPDTGRAFAGLRIPHFEEAKRLCVDAHARLAPEAITLGWDIGMSERGPVFLEVNVWTASYDYEPPDDAYTPSAEWVVRRLRELEG